MKKIIITTVFLSATALLHAQADGNQQLYYERFTSAENTFHQVLQQQPDNAQAWLGLTKAYIGQTEFQKAADSLLAAPASVKSTPFYQAAYGTALLQLGKKDSAQIFFNQALKETRQRDAAILAAVASAHINAEKGDAAYAVSLLEKAIRRDRNSAEYSVLLGDAYLKQANGSEAYKAYQDAMEKDKNYAAAYHKMGLIFLSQKNPDMYLQYFNKAVAADANYAPSLYRLYAHAFYQDPAKAMVYYNDYAAKSDPSVQTDYDLTDLLYLNKSYDKAIQKAQAIAAQQAGKTEPRLFKLLGYSYAGLKDTAKAITYMQQYFDTEEDSNIISKDHIALSEFYGSAGNDSLAMVHLAAATTLESDSTVLYGYFKKLASLAGKQKDYAAQAKWMQQYYNGNDQATNLDLFNWALAHLRAEEYAAADSVFGMYVAKYPEQSFGYYWQAKAKAMMDKEMTQGLAIPAYQKLIEVLQLNTADANYKKWLVEAYAYLAAYEANTEKDYAQAVDYFEKVLEVDPENESAKKYIAILEKDASEKGSQ
jgi:tetratricopeptide (TPR) repeat protein